MVRRDETTAAAKPLLCSESGERSGWRQRVSRLAVCRWLPSGRWLLQRSTSRVLVLVVLVLICSALMLVNTGYNGGSRAALGGQYRWLNSAALPMPSQTLKTWRETPPSPPPTPSKPAKPVEPLMKPVQPPQPVKSEPPVVKPVPPVVQPMQPLSSTLCSPSCPCACRPWRATPPPPPPVISNCGPTADRRGAGQKVIAYTYYGNNVTAYLSGIARNAQRSLTFYPGWTVRVYHDGNNTFPEWDKTACEVTCKFSHVDFCDVRRIPGLGDISNQTATVWRFAALADTSVERFIMRDLDSILTQRERDAVDEWLASNKTFHIMRDHPWHGTHILAGMWGGWNRYNDKYSAIRRKMFQDVDPKRAKSWDQRLLSTVLWPELKRTGDVISHDSYQCEKYPFTQPWPTQRYNMTEFVGSQWSRKVLTVFKECPVKCRPVKHKDWKYC